LPQTSLCLVPQSPSKKPTTIEIAATTLSLKSYFRARLTLQAIACVRKPLFYNQFNTFHITHTDKHYIIAYIDIILLP